MIRYAQVAARLHRAALDAARQVRNLTAADVELLVALHELGGQARTDDLAVELCCHPSRIRRSVAWLRGGGYVTVRAVDLGPARRGVQSVLLITDGGARVAVEVLAAAVPE